MNEYQKARDNLLKLRGRFLRMAEERERMGDAATLGSTAMCMFGRADAYQRCASELEAVLGGHPIPPEGEQFAAAEAIVKVANGETARLIEVLTK